MHIITQLRSSAVAQLQYNFGNILIEYITGKINATCAVSAKNGIMTPTLIMGQIIPLWSKLVDLTFNPLF